MTQSEAARQIAREILAQLNQPGSSETGAEPEATGFPVGISNRHIHLCRSDMDRLFGSGAELTRMKAVKQPGQYAAEEKVTLAGPKGEIRGVRVLGPLRAETQVELSVSDSFRLGLKAPVRMSGDLAGSPGLSISGPCGSVDLESGVIVAWRHVHISPEQAARQGFRDGDSIAVRCPGDRGGIMENVRIRVSADAVCEMHIDMEEANAFGLKNNDRVRPEL